MSRFQIMATDGGDSVGKEKSIEQKLVRATKGRGGICPKLVSPGFDGMPDRLILLPRRKMGFVEIKSPGKKPRPIQESRHRLLRRLGFKVYVLDNAEDIPRVLDGIGGIDGKCDVPAGRQE